MDPVSTVEILDHLLPSLLDTSGDEKLGGDQEFLLLDVSGGRPRCRAFRR